MKHPKETSCYIFRSKCSPPSLANQKFCAVTRALQPHYQEKSNSIGIMSHYPREQAERSRFCQVDPANVSSCVWLGLPWSSWLAWQICQVCLIFCTLNCSSSHENIMYEFVIGGESHTHTHNKALQTQQRIASTLALPIQYIIRCCTSTYSECPHSLNTQKNPFQSK